MAEHKEQEEPQNGSRISLRDTLIKYTPYCRDDIATKNDEASKCNFPFAIPNLRSIESYCKMKGDHDSQGKYLQKVNNLKRKGGDRVIALCKSIFDVTSITDPYLIMLLACYHMDQQRFHSRSKTKPAQKPILANYITDYLCDAHSKSNRSNDIDHEAEHQDAHVIPLHRHRHKSKKMKINDEAVIIGLSAPSYHPKRQMNHADYPQYHVESGQRAISGNDVITISRINRRANDGKSDVITTKQCQFAHFLDEEEFAKRQIFQHNIHDFEHLQWCCGDTAYLDDDKETKYSVVKIANEHTLMMENSETDDGKTIEIDINTREIERINTFRIGFDTADRIDWLNHLLQQITFNENTSDSFIIFFRLYINYYSHCDQSVHKNIMDSMTRIFFKALCTMKHKIQRNRDYQELMSYFIEKYNISGAAVDYLNKLRNKFWLKSNFDGKMPNLNSIYINIPYHAAVDKGRKGVVDELALTFVESLAQKYGVSLSYNKELVLVSGVIESNIFKHSYKRFQSDKDAIRSRSKMAIQLQIDAATFTKQTNLPIGKHGSFTSAATKYVGYKRG
eukprot:75161_1